MQRGPLFVVAMIVVFTLPGCAAPFVGPSEGVTEPSCEDDPSISGCFEEVITVGDCLPTQVFTGDFCRTMLKPEALDYGEDSVTLSVGDRMQDLTPSFLGDAPSLWIVNPPLPEGISIDPQSGVISGSATAETIARTHTIISSNPAGSSSHRIQFSILPLAVQSIDYLSDTMHCTLGEECRLTPPSIAGGSPVDWSVDPPLASGLQLGDNGSIYGFPASVGDSNHTVSATNPGGGAFAEIRVITLPPPPLSLDYGAQMFILTYGQPISLSPTLAGGEAISWDAIPMLPSGLELGDNGAIVGTPNSLQGPVTYSISATNSAGSIQTAITIEIRDLPVWDLAYSPSVFDLSIGDSMTGFPSWGGGQPTSWEVYPTLPQGFFLDLETGAVSGTSESLQDWSSHTIWANNSGGGDYTEITFRVISTPPSQFSWASEEFALEANESIEIRPNYSGPEIDSWEVSPQLPDGLYIAQNGTISGSPLERSGWLEYTVWANNTGGESSSSIWIAVHDLWADQADLLSGMGQISWGGWPSPILPIGKWAFPIGFAEGGYTSDIPVISASHVGKGRMLGYGHESWVVGNGGPDGLSFALGAVEWACGVGADVGLAYGAGYDEFQDELEGEGHTVHLSVTPDNLTGIDCLLDEFWNGHDDQDNQNIVEFLLSGGGVIMGGHAWYWSYSNTDVAHNYPGNKISKTTGLFVSDAWGYNDVDMSEVPHQLTRPHSAIDAIRSDRLDNRVLSLDEASIADATLSICTGVVTLDYVEFWGSLREVVNLTGWTVIEYGTLWEDVGYNLGEDPVADTLLRVEAALTQGLPANELSAHPSHSEFPGEVPDNATRVSRSITIDGNQSGLPGNFGYASAGAHIRMGTGLYAAPGEVVTVTLPHYVVDSGAYVLVGAHSDNLWGKSQLHRHPEIVRWWYVDNATMEVGNAFGGPIYIAIEAGSTLGPFEVSISDAIKAPRYVHGETSLFQWLEQHRHEPAPWAEIGSDLFVLTVPSHEIRELDDPDELMDWWDQALGMEHELYGYTPWPRVERAVFDAQISAGWMHSGYPFMAHDLSVAGVVNVSTMSEEGDWGMFHELGHNHQWMPSTLPGTTETGCNFASVHLMEDLVGVTGHGAVDMEQREARMRAYFDDGSNIDNWSVWVALDTFLIVKDEWTWGAITDALSIYYTLPQSEVPSSDGEKFNAWVTHLSNTTGYNLAPYHAAWGFPLEQSTYDALDNLPVWVDDPLRGEYFEYQAILRDLYAPSISGANSVNISWETYDNGTNITLTIFYGTNDGGNQPSSWSSYVVVGSTEVGSGTQEITGLTCCGTTYHARIRAANDVGETWFGPISWTTDYLLD